MSKSIPYYVPVCSSALRTLFRHLPSRYPLAQCIGLDHTALESIASVLSGPVWRRPSPCHGGNVQGLSSPQVRLPAVASPLRAGDGVQAGGRDGGHVSGSGSGECEQLHTESSGGSIAGLPLRGITMNATSASRRLLVSRNILHVKICAVQESVYVLPFMPTKEKSLA